MFLLVNDKSSKIFFHLNNPDLNFQSCNRIELFALLLNLSYREILNWNWNFSWRIPIRKSKSKFVADFHLFSLTLGWCSQTTRVIKFSLHDIQKSGGLFYRELGVSSTTLKNYSGLFSENLLNKVITPSSCSLQNFSM